MSGNKTKSLHHSGPVVATVYFTLPQYDRQLVDHFDILRTYQYGARNDQFGPKCDTKGKERDHPLGSMHMLCQYHKYS